MELRLGHGTPDTSGPSAARPAQSDGTPGLAEQVANAMCKTLARDCVLFLMACLAFAERASGLISSQIYFSDRRPLPIQCHINLLS